MNYPPDATAHTNPEIEKRCVYCHPEILERRNALQAQRPAHGVPSPGIAGAGGIYASAQIMAPQAHIEAEYDPSYPSLVSEYRRRGCSQARAIEYAKNDVWARIYGKRVR